jgi:hypothetical protein
VNLEAVHNRGSAACICALLRLGVCFRPDWPLEITGNLAQVGGRSRGGFVG